MSVLELTSKEFDLRYRPAVGERNFYRESVCYRNLDEIGQVVSLDYYQGDLERVVDSVDGAGRVIETITWQNVVHATGDGPDGPLEDAESLAWANGYSYTFSAEEDEPHWSIEGWPRDLVGWFVHCLVIDAHYEYDFLRSVHHGAIDRLKRVGDVVVPPDNERGFPIHFPPLVDVPAFTKRELKTTFVGLTLLNDEPCALLEFDMDASPFIMTMDGGELKMTPRFSGTLTSRIRDGVLESGEFTEWVLGMGGSISPRYEIKRISAADYASG